MSIMFFISQQLALFVLRIIIENTKRKCDFNISHLTNSGLLTIKRKQQVDMIVSIYCSLFGGGRGIHEPIFAPMGGRICLVSFAHICMSRPLAAYAGFKSVCFHDKNQREIPTESPLGFYGGGCGIRTHVGFEPQTVFKIFATFRF